MAPSVGTRAEPIAAPNPLRGLGLLSLFLLINISIILTVYHVARTPSADGVRYDASAVLLFSESIKLLASCLLGVGEARSVGLFVRLLVTDLRTTKRWLQLTVPASLYLIQNRLIFVALANLSPVAFQITYQLKIPFTAIFSAIILGRRFPRIQIYAMLALAVGVALVQIDLPRAPKVVLVVPEDAELDTRAIPTPPLTRSHLLGLLSVTICAMTSGFASVYFEALLKRGAPVRPTAESAKDGDLEDGVPLVSAPDGEPEHRETVESGADLRSEATGPALSTLVISNILLSAYSAAALPFVVVLGGGTLRYDELTRGFTPLVWMIVLLTALGGLIIALVIRDNVTKTFALTVSVLICAAIQYNLRPGGLFLAGSTIVIVATWAYVHGQN